MDKPVSLSMKAWIIRNMSVRTATQESVIETVVNHQFEAAYIALENCNSLEFSGFGKWFFNKPKAVKKLEKLREQINVMNSILEEPSLTATKRKNAQAKADILKKMFEGLNRKLNGNVEDIRGMEKQVVSPQGIEGTNTEGKRGENEDMREM
jgi:nucleoid DNA-binding protein